VDPRGGVAGFEGERERVRGGPATVTQRQMNQPIVPSVLPPPEVFVWMKVKV